MMSSEMVMEGGHFSAKRGGLLQLLLPNDSSSSVEDPILPRKPFLFFLTNNKNSSGLKANVTGAVKNKSSGMNL